MSFEQLLDIAVKFTIWYWKNLDILLCATFIILPLAAGDAMSGGMKAASILFGLACGAIRVWRIMRKKKQ